MIWHTGLGNCTTPEHCLNTYAASRAPKLQHQQQPQAAATAVLSLLGRGLRCCSQKAGVAAAGGGAAAAAMASIPPNQTIYVQNLYEKLPKTGRHTAGCCGVFLSVRGAHSNLHSSHAAASMRPSTHHMICWSVHISTAQGAAQTPLHISLLDLLLPPVEQSCMHLSHCRMAARFCPARLCWSLPLPLIHSPCSAAQQPAQQPAISQSCARRCTPCSPSLAK